MTAPRIYEGKYVLTDPELKIFDEFPKRGELARMRQIQRCLSTAAVIYRFTGSASQRLRRYPIFRKQTHLLIRRCRIFFSILLTVFLAASASVLGQTSGFTANDNGAYAECQRLLDSPPLSMLHNYVPTGRGAVIDTHEYGAALTGVRCSEEQLTTFMEREGFFTLETDRWAPPINVRIDDVIDTRLSFCAPPTTLLNKILRRKCGVTAHFTLLNEQVVRINAAAIK